MAKSRSGYWVVRWGESERITSSPTSDATEACRQCYGMCADNMTAKLIGNKAQVRSAKFRAAVLADPLGWVRFARVHGTIRTAQV